MMHMALGLMPSTQLGSFKCTIFVTTKRRYFFFVNFQYGIQKQIQQISTLPCIQHRQIANKFHIFHKSPNRSQQTTKIPTDPNEPPMNQDAKNSTGPNGSKLTRGSTNPNGLKIMNIILLHLLFKTLNEFQRVK